jgi:hypothetical protein
MKVLRVKPIMSVEESDLLAGKYLSDTDCKRVVSEDCDLYDAESGKLLAKLRKGVIPGLIQSIAYENFLPAATPTDSRPTAGGKDSNEKNASGFRVKKDGKVSRQTIAKEFVNSGVAGYYDRSPRFPNCRLTAFNRHHLDKFKNAYPIIKLVDSYYKKLVPKEYKMQRELADRTAQDFVIPDTAFTTITVNKNYRTAVHKDSGDFKDGFGNLVALRKGTYTGCYLTLPRWGVGFDLQNGDLLLMDVHQWHGNTPMVLDDKRAVRLSLVMYYRENMIHCGSMKQELEKVKSRKKGTPLKKDSV